MSSYPMTIWKKAGRADSVSGGKDYHLVRIEANGGRALNIHRWGKKDQWGVGFEVFQFSDHGAARSAARAKDREKFSRYYDQILFDKKDVVANAEDLKKVLGPQYWAKIGAANLTFLDHEIDATGSKEQKNRTFEEVNGKFRLSEEPKLLVEEEPEPAPKVEDFVKQNSTWGMF